jgi:MFS superfamily sulfate permease-like transporter
MVLSLFVHGRHSYQPANRLLSRAPGGGWKLVKLPELAELAPGLVLYRFGSGLFYANSNGFAADVRYLAEHAPRLKWLAVTCDAVDDIDFTGSVALRELRRELEQRGVTLVLSSVAPHVRAELDRDGLTTLIGERHIFTSPTETVEAYERLQS